MSVDIPEIGSNVARRRTILQRWQQRRRIKVETDARWKRTPMTIDIIEIVAETTDVR